MSNKASEYHTCGACNYDDGLENNKGMQSLNKKIAQLKIKGMTSSAHAKREKCRSLLVSERKGSK